MDIVNEVIEAYGGVKATQTRFGYETPQGVYDWRRRGIPFRHIYTIHLEKEFPLERLQERPCNQAA